MARETGQPDLRELERDLEASLDLENPWGRLIAALAVSGEDTRELLVSQPPRAARRPSGPMVKDSSRGERRVWNASFPWEGAVWLGALEQALPNRPGALEVIGYLSEPPEVRRMLAAQATARLRSRGHRARLAIRSSYKPAFFWALEELLPALRRVAADEVLLRVPVVPFASRGRFLQEAYPLSAILEREKIAFRTELIEREQPVYDAIGFRGGRELWRGTCLAPQAKRAIIADEMSLCPTGWLELRSGGATLSQTRLPTDGERFWDWYALEVLPQILASSPSDGLFFKRLTVRAHLSEPDLPLGVDTERASMLEALSEEVYFSTLEACQRHRNLPLGGRGLKTGQIVPLIEEHLGQPGRARVILDACGEGEIGARGTDGVLVRPDPARLEFQLEDARNGAVSIAGSPDALERLGHRYALERDGLIPTLEAVWPTGLELHADRSRRRFAALPAQAPPEARALPSGPMAARDIWLELQRIAQSSGASLHVPSYSHEGRPIPALTRFVDPGAPTMLVTSGQHANEPTGPKAALVLLEQWLEEGQLNLVGLPLKNPDGARLYRALTRIHAEHMHHPARYTALGTDVQADLSRAEGRALEWAFSQHRPRVHLNLHGYPSHEWTRPYTGYGPRGFESWALPMGVMVILAHTPDRRSLAQALAEEIAAALNADPEIRDLTHRSLERRAHHTLENPFRLIEGMPFQFWEREPDPEASDLQRRHPEYGLLTVITEIPDETIYGRDFEIGVRAQVLIGQTIARWLLARA